ncbi:MAG TPA: D-aminoacyl-tRNA deacylase [Candidatus Deferrimicrobium sp.]|nr:D-aminoacyl-tRNA deacylase [Candidatus Deferrimicrobium sp.]
MRALLQRVKSGKVSVDQHLVGEIQAGIVVLVGVGLEDNETDAKYLADKILGLRIFEDEQGKINLSVSDVGGKLLVISQFTLYWDCRKGRRPSFNGAAPPEQAKLLYEYFVNELRKSEVGVETGEFQADMLVEINNSGPVTVWLDSKDRKRE